MSGRYFITMTSQDRPGVLAAVTTALAELGGDMKYATQTVVHGLFTMTVAAEFPPHRNRDAIRDHLLDVGRAYDMEVLIRDMPPEETLMRQEGERFFLSITGKDAPGVVRAICALLARELVDIQRMFAVPSSPKTFSLVMQINIPGQLQIESLAKELESFGAINGLEIALQHEDDFNQSQFPREITTEILPGT